MEARELQAMNRQGEEAQWNSAKTGARLLDKTRRMLPGCSKQGGRSGEERVRDCPQLEAS